MDKNLSTKKEVVRISGKLKEVVTVKDEKGNVLQKIISPIMVEFYLRDLIQVMVGASILAVPVAFTEEVWNLGKTLPMLNVMMILGLSIAFVSLFVYYNFYKNRFKGNELEFFKRVFSTYMVSLLVVALLLGIIQRTPWSTDMVLSIKRVILVTFPASMSAAVADMIK